MKYRNINYWIFNSSNINYSWLILMKSWLMYNGSNRTSQLFTTSFYQLPLCLTVEKKTRTNFRFFYNFNTDTPTIKVRPDTISTGLYSSSYCDKNGQILFFSNGLKILDRNGAIVENGEGLNPTVVEWQSQYSYPGGQSGFFLENPSTPNIVYFISLDFGDRKSVV